MCQEKKNGKRETETVVVTAGQYRGTQNGKLCATAGVLSACAPSGVRQPIQWNRGAARHGAGNLLFRDGGRSLADSLGD